jgi:hypothetical protein
VLQHCLRSINATAPSDLVQRLPLAWLILTTGVVLRGDAEAAHAALEGYVRAAGGAPVPYLRRQDDSDRLRDLSGTYRVIYRATPWRRGRGCRFGCGWPGQSPSCLRGSRCVRLLRRNQLRTCRVGGSCCTCERSRALPGATGEDTRCHSAAVQRRRFSVPCALLEGSRSLLCCRVRGPVLFMPTCRAPRCLALRRRNTATVAATGTPHRARARPRFPSHQPRYRRLRRHPQRPGRRRRDRRRQRRWRQRRRTW